MRPMTGGPTRRVVAALALLVAMTGVGAVRMAPAGAGLTAPEIIIRTLHSGKAMDVFQASHAPGAPVVQWTPNGGDNQLWRVVEFGTGTDLFILQSVESGLVLDVSGGSTANNASLVQSPWTASVSQLWLILRFGETDFFLLPNVNSGKVADAAGAAMTNGSPFVQWTWHGGLNQLFSGQAVNT